MRGLRNELSPTKVSDTYDYSTFWQKKEPNVLKLRYYTRIADLRLQIYSGFQLSATEIRYLGAQLALKVRRALGRASRLQLQTTAICYKRRNANLQSAISAMKRTLLISAAFIEVCFILIVRSGDLLQHTTAYLFFYFAVFAACVFSYYRCRALSTRALALVLLFAALFRVTLLFAPPTLSGDSYRYVWDGMITAHGINPYQYEPRNPALQQFQSSDAFRAMNSQAFLTVYPPTSQYLFFLAYKLFGENPIGLKIIFSTFDFAVVIMLYLLLKEFARPLEGLFLYAWNPLPIVEFSGSGHSDSGMLFFLLLSVYLLRKRRVTSSMISLALAIWSKLVPLICIPFYLLRIAVACNRNPHALSDALFALYRCPLWACIADFSGMQLKSAIKKAPWRSLAVLLLALVVLFLPFLDLQVLKASAGSVENLYYRVMAFNAGLHYLICNIARTYFDADLNQRSGPVLRTIFFIFAIFLFFYREMKDELDLMRVIFYLMFAALLLATQVHPWYVTWALIFVPFFPKPSILYLSGAVALSYLTYAVVPWRERTWVLLIEYVPVYALLALEVILSRRAARLQTTAIRYRSKPKLMS